MSYPNQKKISIHKPKYDEKYTNENGPFMQIGIDEWQEAYKSVEGNPSALAMYFYLASNADGYEKYLSSADFKNAVGKSKSSYHRGIDLLKEKGYIYTDACGGLNFATTPQESCQIELHNWEGDDAKMKLLSSKSDTEQSQNWNAANSNLNIEIDNKDNTNKNKDNRELKKASPSSLSYLRETIAPNGEYIGGEKKGQWLEDEVPNLWGLSRLGRITAICNNTDFSEDDAHIISYSILDWRNRKINTIRPIDFEKDIFFIGE